MKPSDYVRRQTRFLRVSPRKARTARGAPRLNRILMWGSDYPHPEGIDNPLDTFEFTKPEPRHPPGERPVRGNAAALLQRA